MCPGSRGLGDRSGYGDGNDGNALGSNGVEGVRYLTSDWLVCDWLVRIWDRSS